MPNTDNAKVLLKEMQWLQTVIDQAICTYLMQEGHENEWQNIAPPDIKNVKAPFAESVNRWDLDIYGRLALALSLAPQLKPEVLDIFLGKNQLYDRAFTEFGGHTGKGHSGFLPTLQTFIFLITVNEPEMLDQVFNITGPESLLVKENVIAFLESEEGAPKFSALMYLNERWLKYFLTGEFTSVEDDKTFPAHHLTTNMDWDDVILSTMVMEQVNEISAWISHGETLMNEWGLDKKIKPGYRALFYGPPGTGKTLTATLLGKASQKQVFRVDLSAIVSKYIGETEKNLAKLFDAAKFRQWILFFDEADALFGKRTAANSSNDRYANEQTAYLLQRIEDFPGVIILASNLRANMDDAFTRRFQSIIHFNMPTAEERYKLWMNAFSGKCKLNDDVDLYSIAEQYEMAGGAIINVLRFCALKVIGRSGTSVDKSELLAGIKRELKKENKTINYPD